MSKPSNSKILSLNTVLTFGKYRGFTIEEVINNDPQWLGWAISEQLIELDNFAYLQLQDKLKQQ